MSPLEPAEGRPTKSLDQALATVEKKRASRSAGVRFAGAALMAAVASCAQAGTNRLAPPGVEATAGSPIVIGRSFTIASEALRGKRTINIYLPDDYGHSGKAFPVLFLLDGGVHEDFLHIAGLSQISSAYGAGEEMIVVGIAGADRRHDLTTPSSLASDLKAAPTSGGALAYRRFLVDELKPWIAARYRTNGRTAIIGESLAGLFVLQTFLDEPAAFSDYIAVSPSLWWNSGQSVTGAATKIPRARYSGQRLWVGFETPPPPEAQAARDRSRQDALHELFSKTRPHGLSWKFVHVPEGHGSVYHPAALQAFRDLYAKQAD